MAADPVLLDALAAGSTYAEAASIAGCSERTVRRRMASPAFRALLADLRSEWLGRTTDLLAAEGHESVRFLAQVRADADADLTLRVRCAALLLAEGRAHLTAHDLDVRLSALEAIDQWRNSRAS